MANKKLSFTQEELNAVIAQAVAQALATQPTSTGKGKAKTVKYTKENGETVMATPAQAKAWDKWKANGKGRGTREENLKVWESNREAYKPTKALKDAIKADRASITRKVAKEKYGFVGTKDDLKALKDSICK